MNGQVAMKGVRVVLLAAAVVAAWGLWVAAEATVWNVSTPSALTNAVNSCSPGDEIVVAAGTYNMTNALWIDVADVTIRGATGNRDDVVLRGGGMNVSAGSQDNLVHLVNDDITIQDLTVADCYENGIQLHGENNIDRAVLSNVKTLNIGERHIKGSKGSISNAMWDVLIENCHLLQTEARQTRPGHPVDPDDYIGGIDCMVARSWIIRDSVFEGIEGAAGDARGAIFLWQGVTDPLIERNVFIGCARGIAMGNPYNPDGSYLVDGAIIRNNMVLKGNSVGFEADHTRNVKVYNNTIFGYDATYHRTIQIDDDGGAAPTTGLVFTNNIIRGDVMDTAAGDWTAASIAAMGNIVDNVGTVVQASWFVDPAGGDLHLTTLATPALGAGIVVADAQYDFDGDYRGAAGLACDMGADEQAVAAAPIIAEVTPDPDTVYAGVEYVEQLTLVQGYVDTWTLPTGPSGAGVSQSGLVSGWTPQATDIGSTFDFEAQATNDVGSDTESWQVTVVAPPAPVIDEVTPDPDSASVDIEYVRPLSLSQGAGTGVSWTLLDGPTGASVDPNGLVSGWTPTASDAGALIDFEVQANNAGGSDIESWQVLVVALPDAFIESGGMVCFEAEHYDDVAAGSGGVSQTWQLQTGNGSSGDEYMAALPITVPETRVDTNIEATSPRLRYMVSFTTTGTYYLWIRGYGVDGTTDSVHYGLDNVSFSYSYETAPKLTVGTAFGWINEDGNTSRLTVSIASAGVYAVDIWMRENGPNVDKLVLTTEGGYTPSGTGPAESPHGGNPALVTSEPTADGTLPKTQNNVILLTFDKSIALPTGPALSIFGGGFEEGGAFAYSIEPDGVTLKAVEQGPMLTDQTWYQITPAVGFAVEPFAFDVCTLVGDANNSGRVTTADYSEVKAHMSEYTDARYDLNGSGRVTTADYSVVKSHMGGRTPAKP